MESFYYFISLTGLCAFLLHTFTENFHGANLNIKSIFDIVCVLGFVCFFALIVVMFFKVTWWKPICLFAVVSAIAGFIHPVGKNLFVALISAVGVLIFGILSWTSLF